MIDMDTQVKIRRLCSTVRGSLAILFAAAAETHGSQPMITSAGIVTWYCLLSVRLTYYVSSSSSYYYYLVYGVLCVMFLVSLPAEAIAPRMLLCPMRTTVPGTMCLPTSRRACFWNTYIYIYIYIYT